MRENIVALVSMDAQTKGAVAKAGGSTRRQVAELVMSVAFANYMAPGVGEAFAGACAALYALYPDDAELRQEVEAIGDRNRVFLALESGVPVDFEAVTLREMPAEPLGLVELMRAEARRRGY